MISYTRHTPVEFQYFILPLQIHLHRRFYFSAASYCSFVYEVRAHPLSVLVAPQLLFHLHRFTAAAPPTLRFSSETLLSIVPTIDLDIKCCSAFESTIMWQRKLLISLKAMFFILTCALAVASSMFSYNIRSRARSSAHS
jgi:hypothetical protein